MNGWKSPRLKWPALNGCRVAIVMVKGAQNVPVLEAVTIPNKNYLRGRRFEYERLKYYKEVMKHDALRTAGSHGTWDIVDIDSARGIVNFIQCKVVSSESTAKRLLSNFKSSPPYPPAVNFHQTLEVKVTGSTEVHCVTI